MNKLIITYYQKKSTYFIIILLLIGLIIGPFYSVDLYLNVSNSHSKYGTEYDTSPKNSNFLSSTKRIFGRIEGGVFSIYNSSIYAMVNPDQNINKGIFDNFADNGTYEFLELNFTSNFNKIVSIKSYKLPNMLLNYQFMGPYFDGNQFWTFSFYPLSLYSFNKQGIVLTNKTITQPISDNSLAQTLYYNPLGIYNNQFWILKTGWTGSTEVFQNISSYSLTTFSEVFSRSIKNIGVALNGNIDKNNVLWLRYNFLPVDNISYSNSANQTVTESYYGFSMNEIVNSTALSINQAILVNNGIQSIYSYNFTTFGWITSDIFWGGEAINDGKIFQINTGIMQPYQDIYTNLLGSDMLVGVEINSPIPYHIGNQVILTVIFGYFITGLMAIIILKNNIKRIPDTLNKDALKP